MRITMPKVDQKHVVEKKRLIVDAAIRVCKSKPAYAVTLRDVVKECGISQGGLYHYFKDIDEIFAEILNRSFSENRIDKHNFKIFESNKPPREIIIDSFAIWGQLMDDITNQYGSLIYELNAIYLREPKRMKKMLDRLRVNDDAKTFHDKIFSFIETHVANGNFELMVPKEDLRLIVDVTMAGIQQSVTFSRKLYDKESSLEGINEYTTAKAMMIILAHAINGLLCSSGPKFKI